MAQWQKAALYPEPKFRNHIYPQLHCTVRCRRRPVHASPSDMNTVMPKRRQQGRQTG